MELKPYLWERLKEMVLCKPEKRRLMICVCGVEGGRGGKETFCKYLKVYYVKARLGYSLTSRRHIDTI